MKVVYIILNQNIIFNLCFRYKHDLPEKLEECSYYNQNYSVFAKNGYNWSMNHINNNSSPIPCQYYGYSNKESVVTEVCL